MFTKEFVCKQLSLPEDTKEAIVQIQDITDMLEIVYKVCEEHVKQLAKENKQHENFKENLRRTIFLN